MQRKNQALAAATVAAVVAGALWKRRQQATGTDEATTAGRFIGHDTTRARNAKLASVGAKAGSGYAVHRAGAFAAERRDELDRQFELRTAEQVTEALGHMKGAMMKLGQMASYLDQGLPDHVREALADLQKDAPPMSAELAAGVVRAELGDEPEAVFAEWDPTPIASASIGQVHRAITHDGRAVAVKLQYPGVDTAVASDLDNVGLLFAGMGQLFPGFDHKPFVEEIRQRLIEELDYSLEADNQRRFAAYYDGHPFIEVPRVVDELCTPRVLTTELAEGVHWEELLTWDQDEKDLAAETLYRFAFGSLYRLQAFNGDPHPGNYLFRPGGHVTFLDFGLVKHFTQTEIDYFEAMIRSIVIDPDPAAFRRTIEDLGLLAPGAAFSDEQVVDYFGHFYEFILQDGSYTITPEYASETVRRYFDQRGPYGDIMRAANLPPPFVIIQRINLGLYALFGELHATANRRRLAEEIWPFVDAGPATPMGEAVAAWEATLRTGRRQVGSLRSMSATHQHWVERDTAVVWHGFTRMSCFADNEPVIVAAAEGRELIDVDGRRFLDAISSLWVTTLGHGVPELDEAARAQLDRVAHSTLLGNGNVATIELAEDLVPRLPVPDAHLLFASDGAAAVEQALKIAFQHWANLGIGGRDRYLALGGAYHGDTVGSLSVGAGGFGTDLFDPLRFPVVRAPGYDDPDWADAAIALLDEHAEHLAAMVLEPLVQGAAGMQVTDPDAVRRVAEAAQSRHVLVVADEVATGFGRTGTLFASEQCGIAPDLMAIGKGITGGYLPLSATAASPEVYRSFLGADLSERTFYHGHSYSGNALACAVARRHLALIDEWSVLAHVRDRADQLADRLAADVAPLGAVAEVRQRGLMVGVELDPPGPDRRWGRRTCAAAVRRGVLLRPLGDVVILMPPLTTTAEEIDRIVDVLVEALAEVAA